MNAPALRRVDDGAVARLVSGDVACNIQLVGLERRGRVARYEIHVVNGALVPIGCRVVAVGRNETQAELTAVGVAAGGYVRARVAVPLRRRVPCERIDLQLVGDGIDLVASAAPPAPPPRGALRALMGRIGIAAGLAVAGASVTVPGWIAPPALALAPPPAAVAGGTVRTAYEMTGARYASFVALDPGGTTLASGVLQDPVGQIAFSLPADEAGKRVRVEVRAGGRVREARRELAFTVSAPPPDRIAPRIVSFAAHRDSYAGRTSVLASYLASGERGSVRVFDQHNAVVGHGDFSRAGTTRLALAPNADGALLAELEVRRGTQRTTATVEIPAVTTPPAKKKMPPPDPAARLAFRGADPIALPAGVRSGREFRIRVRPGVTNLRVALQDKRGTTLDAIEVPHGARAASLLAPADAAGTYYLVATYGRGAAGEVAVRSLRVSPG